MNSKLIGRIQRGLAQSSITTRFAVRLKHQMDSVIGLRLSHGINPDINGEHWLAEHVAPASRFFVDVGANVGSWATMFARYMKQPRGLAIEPSPGTASALKANLRTAGLSDVHVLEAAIADYDGESPFFAEPSCGETSSLLQRYGRDDSQEVRISVKQLDAVLHDQGVESIDMLKIDAEGYDLRVLKGATQSLKQGRISVIQFEYNSPWAAVGSTLSEAFGLLEGFGYEIRNLQPKGFFRVRPEKTGEFFRYSNFVAFLPRGPGSALASVPAKDPF
jgi:FkbM family methyltransferase